MSGYPPAFNFELHHPAVFEISFTGEEIDCSKSPERLQRLSDRTQSRDLQEAAVTHSIFAEELFQSHGLDPKSQERAEVRSEPVTNSGQPAVVYVCEECCLLAVARNPSVHCHNVGCAVFRDVALQALVIERVGLQRINLQKRKASRQAEREDST